MKKLTRIQAGYYVTPHPIYADTEIKLFKINCRLWGYSFGGMTKGTAPTLKELKKKIFLS